MKDFEVEIGTIEIQRSKGIGIWNITSGNFSIDKLNDRYRLNFWVESNGDYIQKLDDTGETPVIFEIKLPFKEKPVFNQVWKYDYPGYKEIGEENFGQHRQRYWDNFYYYEHESLEEIKMQILQIEEKMHKIIVSEFRCDPINWKLGNAKYKITAKLEIKNTFESYWLTQE